MKKIIKSRIFAFILGAIIFGSIGVIAANYASNTINFTPEDTTWKKQDGSDIKTVKDALDDLYIKSLESNLSNITVLDSNRTSFSIPENVEIAYLIIAKSTGENELGESISGSILNDYEMVSDINYIDNDSAGALRQRLRIYKLNLNGNDGNITCSLSGGSWSRAWAAGVFYN